MIDDYVIAVSAGVIVAASVILASFLLRYGKLVDEANQSTRLAKDVWDSVSARFAVVDARIIDLMAKSEVLASKVGVTATSAQVGMAPVMSVKTESEPSKVPAIDFHVVQGEGTETEKRVLRFLGDGPRNSAQIREQVGKSREHTARLMKSLFERELVVRNARNKPYVYEITEKGRAYLVT